MEEAGSPDGSWREALAAFFTHLLIFCSVFPSLHVTSRKDKLVQLSGARPGPSVDRDRKWISMDVHSETRGLCKPGCPAGSSSHQMCFVLSPAGLSSQWTAEEHTQVC